MTTLRVLLVGPLSPPAGGMANQTQQLCSLLENEGIGVNLIQTNAPYRPAWISRFPYIRSIFRIGPYVARLWSAMSQVDVVHVMANSGWAWHVFAAPPICLAKARRRPVIVNYHGGRAEEFFARSARSVMATLGRTRVVVPSRFLQEIFRRYNIESEIIPNGVDLDRFRPATPPRPVPSLSPHVVIARNLEPVYGIDLALKAVASASKRCPGLRVSIAGSGPELVSLQGLSRELGIEDCVRFTGRLGVTDMAALFQQADLVLNPSRVDNTPTSILEALACGVPVVTTNVGGIPFLVRHGLTAWLTEPESPQALADGMIEVLSDPVLRQTLIANGLALTKTCAWPIVRDRWLTLYRQVATSNLPGRSAQTPVG
jgi:glycosyltransferase involved in cell wall biosynthesis